MRPTTRRRLRQCDAHLCPSQHPALFLPASSSCSSGRAASSVPVPLAIARAAAEQEVPIRFFDCNVIVGPRPFKHVHGRWSAEHLFDDMELCEIDGALVRHALCSVPPYFDAAEGNARLRAEFAKEDAPGRLHAAWVLSPLGFPGWFADSESLLGALTEHNVRAVVLPPRNDGFSLSHQVMGETFLALERAAILTFIDAGWSQPSGDQFAYFDELLSRYPNLPVVLMHGSWSSQWHIIQLMRRHSNLHLEFSTLQANRVLERFAAEFGDTRLLYGSGGTNMSMGAARALVDWANLPLKSKQRIASGNLLRLLKLSDDALPPPRASATLRRPRQTDDILLMEARTGRPLSCTVLDAHSHVLQDGGQTAGTIIMPQGDAAGILELNISCGIDAVAMMSWSGPVNGDCVAGNAVVANAVARFPGRCLGLCTVDPSYMSRDEMITEFEHCHLECGFVGEYSLLL